MNTTQRNLIGLMALALIIAMTPVTTASAAVRVRASVNTPHLSFQVNTHRPAVVYGERRVRTVHPRAVIRITKQDKRMAKRLARYTGYSKRELLDMRRSGYNWKRIGRYLNLRPQVVKAARSARSWERFLNRGCQVAYGKHSRHH